MRTSPAAPPAPYASPPGPSGPGRLRGLACRPQLPMARAPRPPVPCDTWIPAPRNRSPPALPAPSGLSRYVEGVRRGRGSAQPPMHLDESPRVEGPAGLVAELHAHVPTVCDAVHGARLSDKLWQVVETVAGRSRRAGGPEDARGGGHGASGRGSSPLPSWGSTRRGRPASPSGRLCLADT